MARHFVVFQRAPEDTGGFLFYRMPEQDAHPTDHRGYPAWTAVLFKTFEQPRFVNGDFVFLVGSKELQGLLGNQHYLCGNGHIVVNAHTQQAGKPVVGCFATSPLFRRTAFFFASPDTCVFLHAAVFQLGLLYRTDPNPSIGKYKADVVDAFSRLHAIPMSALKAVARRPTAGELETLGQLLDKAQAEEVKAREAKFAADKERAAHRALQAEQKLAQKRQRAAEKEKRDAEKAAKKEASAVATRQAQAEARIKAETEAAVRAMQQQEKLLAEKKQANKRLEELTQALEVEQQRGRVLQRQANDKATAPSGAAPSGAEEEQEEADHTAAQTEQSSRKRKPSASMPESDGRLPKRPRKIKVKVSLISCCVPEWRASGDRGRHG